MDLNAIKAKMKSLNSNKGSREKIDYSKYYWKPKEEGKYNIRIVPSAYNSGFPFTEFYLHYSISKYPIPALSNWGDKDPVIEFAKKLRQSNDKENSELAKKIEPRMRVFAPVIVRGEEEKGVRLWEFSKNIYLQLLGIADDEDYGDYTDIKEGRDFVVELTPDTLGGKKILKPSIRIKPKQTPLSTDSEKIEKWLNEQPDLMSLHRRMEFDELKSVLEKWLSPESEEEETETKISTPSKEIENDLDKIFREKPETKDFTLNKKNKEKSFNELFEDEDED
jgi:hypothetical protein